MVEVCAVGMSIVGWIVGTAVGHVWCILRERRQRELRRRRDAERWAARFIGPARWTAEDIMRREG